MADVIQNEWNVPWYALWTDIPTCVKVCTKYYFIFVLISFNCFILYVRLVSVLPACHAGV